MIPQATQLSLRDLRRLDRYIPQLCFPETPEVIRPGDVDARWLLSSANAGLLSFPSLISGFGRILKPTQIKGLLGWYTSKAGIILSSSVMLSAGTSPPLVTITGAGLTLAFPTSVAIRIAIDSTAGGTARGQATFKYFADGGTTPIATGVTTAATVALTGAASGITANFPTGTYNTNQTWDAPLATWQDQSGGANHLIVAPSSKGPIVNLTGYNSRVALNFGSSSSAQYRLISTNSVSRGKFSVHAAIKGSASSGYILVHNSDIPEDVGNGFYFYASSPSGRVHNSTSGTLDCKLSVSSTWNSDNTARSTALTYGGTQATMKFFRGGVQDSTSVLTAGDPGTTSIAGKFYVGNQQGGGTFPNEQFLGNMSEIAFYNDEHAQQIVTAFHKYFKDQWGI
jgi:hypothetical protein